jgi:uncharacterized protein (TIGR02246 family)
MHPDEQAIRDLIERWARATAAGDIAELMTMMAEDVVFLTPGQGPMRRDDFTAGFLAAVEHVQIDAQSNVQEIQVADDLAYAWNYLDVCVTPRAGGAPKRRCGYTLTILRKLDGAWVIARDANLLAPSL